MPDRQPLRPHTKRLVADDRRFLWHPFTQMTSWMEEEPPLVIEKGKGCWLVDSEGRRYLDGVSSLWCNVHGHRVKAIDRAVRKQLSRISHSTLLGLASPPSIALAKMLVEKAPKGLARVFFSDNGATAVEAAVKMAFQFHAQTGSPRRTLFAALAEAYHGDTVGSISIGGMDLFHGLFTPLRFEVVRIPSPYCYRCPEGLDPPGCALACAARARAVIERHAERLAAVVIEPLVQGAAGIIVHPEGYLGAVADACRRHGVLLIADEVATGFGRTGTLFACEQEGVVPDMLCLAKGLSGGYLPLGATMTTETVFNAFLGAPASRRAFAHGHTFTGNALACAAAIESLGLLVRRVMPTLKGTIDAFKGLLAGKIAPLSHVGDVRSRGLMGGIELVRDRRSREPYPPEERVGHRVTLEARRLGVIVRPLGDVIVLMPPLAITRKEMGMLVTATAAAICKVTGD